MLITAAETDMRWQQNEKKLSLVIEYAHAARTTGVWLLLYLDELET